MSLNPRQESFVQHYITSGNATQSYIDAGYKARGEAAQVSSSKLLSNAMVSKRIRELQSDHAATSKRTRDDLLDVFWSIIENGEKDSDRISAGKEIARMNGWNEPEKVDVSGERQVIDMIAGICGVS